MVVIVEPSCLGLWGSMEHPCSDFYPDEDGETQKARPPREVGPSGLTTLGLGDQPRVRERIMKLS